MSAINKSVNFLTKSAATIKDPESKPEEKTESNFVPKKPEKKVGYSTYTIEDCIYENDVVKSKRRNPSKSDELSRPLFCRVDNDIMDVVDRQQATNGATINALLRFAIDELRKNKKTLNAISG